MTQMALNEIIVIDEDNDDLEEGEIADDIVPDIMVIQPKDKPKQLPRRYTLHNKISSSRHKNCKHKEKKKIQSFSKLEVIQKKKHKSSCPWRGSEKHRLKHKEVHHSHNTPPIKSAFKNYTSPPRAPPLPRKVNSNLQNSENKVDFQNLLSDYKKAKKRLNQKIEKSQNNQGNRSQKNDSVNDCKKINTSTEDSKQEFLNALPNEDLSEMKNGAESDEEDVEELRRIALATRAKKQITCKANEESSNKVPNPSSNTLPNKVAPNHLVETINSECDNDSRDNYEVVDMDLDEEDSCQVVNNDNLYIIDKMPAISEFSSCHKNSQLSQSILSHDPPIENGNHLKMETNLSQPPDDFEEQLLRAEVIASMNSTRQKCQSPVKILTPVEEKVSEIIANVDLLHSTVNMFHNETKQKPCAMYSKGPLQNSVKPLPKRIINAKSKFSNFKNNKATASPPPPRVMNPVQELIINIGNDTSTDESEEEKNENVASPNVPISSIEALISNARQKSDAAQLNNVSSTNVSYLSKTQQEEYNSLKKLLAEKTQYSVPTPIREKNTADELEINLLVKKITVAKTNFEKEVGIKSELEKKLLEKKKNYIASKLRVQMLKEKLHAFEKIRAANLDDWKQCSAKLDIVKKSVAKRESLLKLLETDLRAKNYCVMSDPTIPPV